MSGPRCNPDNYKAAKKALEMFAVIEALCGGFGQYVDKEILEDIVRDMEGNDGCSDQGHGHAEIL